MTRRIDRVLRGPPPADPGWRGGRPRLPAPEKPTQVIRRLNVVSWAALAHAVAQAAGPEDPRLRSRFGVLPPAARAIREGLVRQRIGLGPLAPPGPWVDADLPPALETLHTRAMRWFASSLPPNQAAAASWAQHFPCIVRPGDPGAARLRARALDWLGPATGPRRGAFEGLRTYLTAGPDAQAWQAVVALAHVRAVALGRTEHRRAAGTQPPV